MARNKIVGDFNIPEDILAEAERLGLDATSTGGGIDYVFKVLGKNEDGSDRMAILSDAEDAGSPDSLRSRSEISIILNENWTSAVGILFKTAKEAMGAMGRMYDRSSPVA